VPAPDDYGDGEIGGIIPILISIFLEKKTKG
jgi:hypothetical protein